MKKNNVYELVGISTLLAIVIVLQLISPYLKFGTIPITLTLIPVVIGGILFGIKGGLILGTSFGAVVLIQCFTGIDQAGLILWTANPFVTALLCILKGTMAGIIPALTYKKMKVKNNNLAIIVSTCLAPIVNTALFILGMFCFFYDILADWAGGQNTIIYGLTFLVSINFLIEFLINVILAPVVIRIINIIGKR